MIYNKLVSKTFENFEHFQKALKIAKKLSNKALQGTTNNILDEHLFGLKELEG